MEKIYDVIIVGAGPAGLSAGIYLGRGKVSTLILEKAGVGALLSAHKIENYPGFFHSPSGKEIYEAMKKQALSYNVEIQEATVLGFDPYEEIKIVKTDQGNFKCRYIIIASGMLKAKKVAGEAKYIGAGVSYCATCDGAFTRNRIVSLVGKGEELAEEALFLTRFAKEVHIYVTEETLEAPQEVLKALSENEKVKIQYSLSLKEVKGDEEALTSFVLEDQEGNLSEENTDFLFLYLGTKSNTELFGEFADMDSKGFIKTNDKMQIRTPDMYAIGDIREKEIRQVTTATNDGTIAASMIIKDILTKKTNK
ncbi:NAD(P)/FAD-dependent oxidoreductase [Fusobacterium necrophorum]|uniref:NAD(P)/FAD-dependent oxidoreductase n=1 Tax=Fusobacterium necrophorum TaxID=859 RepID=UPI00370E94A7